MIVASIEEALQAKYGPPIVSDAPARDWTWTKVLLRDLYGAAVPLEVWQSKEELWIPIPFDIVDLSTRYVDGALPPFLHVPNEGIAFLRRLTRGEEDDISEAGEN